MRGSHSITIQITTLLNLSLNTIANTINGSILIKVDLFNFRGLLPHFRPCDDSLENSWFQSFKLSRIFKGVIFRPSKEHFSREYHVIWNGNENCPSLTGLLKVGTNLLAGPRWNITLHGFRQRFVSFESVILL